MKWKEREVSKWMMKALLIGHAFDSKSPLLKLQEVITFGKDNIKVITEVRFEGSVSKENPPMINVFTRVQDSDRCIPINVHAEIILKSFNFNRGLLLQLYRRRLLGMKQTE